MLGALVDYQRQRQTALRLQEDLLPGPPDKVAGLDLATIYEPGGHGIEVGGDWFDVSMSAGRVVASVGDVSGSGVDAAALMGRLRLLAEVEFGRGADARSVFDLLDAVCQEANQFATMLVVELSLETGQAMVWSAGHLPPLRTTGDGSTLVAVTPAPPLGHLDRTRPQPATIEVAEGTGLLLFTDGLVERRSESPEVGLERLCDIVGGTTVPDEIMAILGRQLASATDDVAVLALRRVDTTLADDQSSR